VQDEVNQEDSEQNEVDGLKKRADSTDHLVICNKHPIHVT